MKRSALRIGETYSVNLGQFYVPELGLLGETVHANCELLSVDGASAKIKVLAPTMTVTVNTRSLMTAL